MSRKNRNKNRTEEVQVETPHVEEQELHNEETHVESVHQDDGGEPRVNGTLVSEGGALPPNMGLDGEIDPNYTPPSRVGEEGMNYNWDSEKEGQEEEHAHGEVIPTPATLEVVTEELPKVEVETVPVEAAVAVQDPPKEETPELLPYEPPTNRITEVESRITESPPVEQLPKVDLAKMEPFTPVERQPADQGDWYDVLDNSVGIAPAPVKVVPAQKQSGVRAAVFSALTYKDQSSKDLRAIVPGLTAANFPQSWLKKLSEENPPKVIRTVMGDRTSRYRLPAPKQD